ncbi:MAG: hypothetical protein V1685_06310 [Parcubacteria group bacterium]
MYWYLDTRFLDHARLGIFDSRGKKHALHEIQSKKRLTSGALIRSLYALSGTLRTSKKPINGIIVERGPGGFSAIRLGVVTANALSYAIGIPCLGISSSGPDISSSAVEKAIRILRASHASVVTPFYGSEPSITLRRNTARKIKSTAAQ